MFIVLMPRLGLSHILSYRLANGNWRSLCNKILIQDSTMLTLSADNTYSGLCRICKDDQDCNYQDELNYDPRESRNNFQSSLYRIVDYIQSGLTSTEDAYGNIVKRRWRRLERYKHLLNPKIKIPKKYE
jgi:hypothetical protein